MEKQKFRTKKITDERIEFLTNKYAANAFIFLVYYLFISILIKSFTMDVNIFIYWDNAISMVIGWVYMMYRSADDGVPIAPSAVNVLNSTNKKVFTVVSLLFGLFVAFVTSEMDEGLAALMPGLFEKLAGTLVIGFLFFLVITTLIWLIDVLPTKRAFRKAAELTGEPGEEMPERKELIKQNYVKDERIDSTIEKYATHALYFVVGYILASSLVKFLFTDVSILYYFDALFAALAVTGYLTYTISRTRIYEEHQPG